MRRETLQRTFVLADAFTRDTIFLRYKMLQIRYNDVARQALWLALAILSVA